MLQDRIARRYAKSLFDLALEKNNLEVINADMLALAYIYDNTPEFRMLLRSPNVTALRKKPIITAIFKGKISDMTLLFIENLTMRNREGLVPVISTEFRLLYNQHNNFTEVKLESAVGLNDSERASIIERIEKALKTKVLLKESINPALIGGFSFQIGQQKYDGTVSNALRLIKRQLTAKI